MFTKYISSPSNNTTIPRNSYRSQKPKTPVSPKPNTIHLQTPQQSSRLSKKPVLAPETIIRQKPENLQKEENFSKDSYESQYPVEDPRNPYHEHYLELKNKLGDHLTQGSHQLSRNTQKQNMGFRNIQIPKNANIENREMGVFNGGNHSFNPHYPQHIQQQQWDGAKKSALIDQDPFHDF